MSTRLFEQDVTFMQRFLRCCGLYDGEIDGIWGRETDTALARFDAEGEAIATEVGTYDRMSERHIRTLHPVAQRAAREFLLRVCAGGIEARVLSGTRTYTEQNLLYAKGRCDESPVVTDAVGGRSAHNFGIAWDIGIFTADGRYVARSPDYERAAMLGTMQGVEWGGDWAKFVDRPHFQFATGAKIREIRAMFETGVPFV